MTQGRGGLQTSDTRLHVREVWTALNNSGDAVLVLHKETFLTSICPLKQPVLCSGKPQQKCSIKLG